MKHLFLVLLLLPSILFGSVSVNVNGSSYTIPQTNERGWGTAVTSWIQAISANSLQPIGGSFVLTNDVDFGASYGLKSAYFLSRNSNPATAGLLRLNVIDYIGWRNNANSGNLLLAVDASDNLTFNSNILATRSTAEALTNKTIAFGSNTLTGVASTSTAQVITNKDIDGGTASNANRITVPNNTLTNLQALTRKQGTLVYDTTSNKPYYDDGSNLKVIGSGSGGAGNLIEDGDAEAGITNFIEGSYSAATRPAGTFTPSSGAGAFAISTSTSSPLFGNTSFLLTKSPGASRRGRAIERTIIIDSGYRTKMLKTRIDYTIVSGSFVAGSNGSSPTDSSLIWYVGQYNGSTWSYTEPSTFKMFSNSTTNSDFVEGEFQVNSDTTRIKLIGFISESADSAWVVKAEVGFRLSTFLAGTTTENMKSYTSTLTNAGNAVPYLAYGRHGDKIIIEGTIIIGSTLPTGIIGFSLPSGLNADFSTYPKGAINTDAYQTVGVVNAYRGGQYTGIIQRNVSSTNTFTFAGGNGVADWSTTVPATWVAGDAIRIQATMPILGWSSTTQQSDGYDSRQIVFTGTQSSEALTANTTNITFASSKDSVSGWSTNIYNVKSAGDYWASASGVQSVASSTIAVYKNGTLVGFGATAPAIGTASAVGILVQNCVAGDTISFRATQNVTMSSGLASIFRLQSPTTISATDKMTFMAEGASSSAAGSNVVIPFNTPTEDTHGCWNATNKDCTVPTAGTYKVTCASRITTGGSATVNQYMDTLIQIDTVTKREFAKYVEANVAGWSGMASYQGPLLAGQKIRCVSDTNITSPVLTTGSNHTYLEIMRVK